MGWKRFFLSGAACLALLCAKAGGENYSVGARQAGMGNASITLSDVWAVQYNQAGLAQLTQLAAGIHYGNRFGLKELGLKAAAVAVPVRRGDNGVFGLSAAYFGYSQYNDSKIGIGYGKRLGEKIAFGIQIDYLRTAIGENYGSRGSVAGEAGMIAGLTDNLELGVHVFNPTRTKILEYDIQETVRSERIPTVMKLGLGYRFSENVQVVLEAEKDILFNPVFKGGIEYRVIEQLYLRGGLSSDPNYNSFGFGVNLYSIMFDFAASRHQILGYAMQVGISYQFDKKGSDEGP